MIRQLLLSALFVSQFVVFSQTTLIDTSFETYNETSVFGQDDWIEGNGNDGSAEIVTTSSHVKTGSKGLRIYSSSEVTTSIDHKSYGKDDTGLSSNVYLDFYIKLVTAPVDESVFIRVIDHLPDNGIRRASEIRMYPNGDIKVDGGDLLTSYNLGDWIRVSLSVNYATLKYEVAINGTVLDEMFDFREDDNPAEKGRPSGIHEYHGLRFWYEDGIGDIAVDDLYIGETPIDGIGFTVPTTDRTIDVDQPDRATITLTPDKEIYTAGESVTAEVTGIESHYKFDGWTGSLSGTTNPMTFDVNSNMSIGADIIVDPSDPPVEYTITINQPTGGTITVDPSSGPYYEGSEVEFEVTADIGYEFDSWIGITGSSTSEDVDVTENLTVSANMILGSFTKRTVHVSDTDELEDAMEDMLPGDSIVLANGTYEEVNKSVKNLGGTADYPVYIIAANQGMAKITGKSKFTLENAAHITIRGLDIDVDEVNNIFKLTDCNNIRICYNEISSAKDDGSSKWFEIGGVWGADECFSHHNRIDHNLIENKLDGGALLVIGGNSGDPIPAISQYDRIDHNHFKNNGPRQDNEKETIRVGWSKISLLSAYCTIEDNVFEDCDGDPEIISVKSCDNYVRNNTFRSSLGTVSLRHGDRTEVSGNFFFGEGKTAQFEENTIGCGGVRVYGKDHKIFNNYFEGLTGFRWDAACTITQGDALNEGVTQNSNLTKHYIAENLEFTHNTFVNNFSDIEIGYNDNYGKAPKNILIANNLIIQDSNPVTTVHKDGMDDEVYFKDNIIYTTGNGSFGDITFTSDEAVNVDPLLVETDCVSPETNCDGEYANAFYKLSSGSPAINPTPTNTIIEASSDIEGQASSGSRDIGADEYNTSGQITNGALDARHVGPNAVSFLESGSVLPDEYSIQLTQSTGGTISVSPSNGPYVSGSSVTFTATPDNDYEFTSWSGVSGTNATTTVTITDNLSVSAVFTDISNVETFTISLTQTTGGTVSMSPVLSQYTSGTEITFIAVPASGYDFTSWSGITGSSSVQKVNISEDLSVSAVFTESLTLGKEDLPKEISFYPNPFESSITLEAVSATSVKIYGIDGGLVDSFEVKKKHVWSAPAPGMYFAHLTVNGKKHIVRIMAGK